MSATNPALQDLADRLFSAERDRMAIDRLSDAHPGLSIADAYAIQRVNLQRKLDAGARLLGRKVGITSKAVQDWLLVREPDFGGLLDSMEVADGGVCTRAELLQPRVEGEIAFILGKDLEGTHIGAAQVVQATDCVVAAIEIIDSRITDWKITITDTVADNASSARFVLGTRKTSLTGLDLPLAGCVLRKNGRVASTGAGAACLGNPVTAVAWLARTLSRLQTPLRAGDVVLSGALLPVVPVEAGDFIEVEVAHIGSASVRFD